MDEPAKAKKPSKIRHALMAANQLWAGLDKSQMLRRAQKLGRWAVLTGLSLLALRFINPTEVRPAMEGVTAWGWAVVVGSILYKLWGFGTRDVSLPGKSALIVFTAIATLLGLAAGYDSTSVDSYELKHDKQMRMGALVATINAHIEEFHRGQRGADVYPLNRERYDAAIAWLDEIRAELDAENAGWGASFGGSDGMPPYETAMQDQRGFSQIFAGRIEHLGHLRETIMRSIPDTPVDPTQ